MSAVSWYINRAMVSTYVRRQTIDEKKRFFKSDKTYKMIPCPKAIDTYNQYM